MKKMGAVIISFSFLMTGNIQAALFEAPNPYSFGPQGRAVSDLRDFAKPKQSVSILPNRPVAATDSSGNRVYYTPDGKMTLSIGKDGSMNFSVGGVTKSKSSDGEIKSITRTIQGSGLRQVTRDEKDRVTGYRELNASGKTAATYDKDNNLTSTYHYKAQGAKLDYVQNEMTGGRTYYDEYQRAMYETDFDGYILKTYQYEDISYETNGGEQDRKSLNRVKAESNGGANNGLLVSTRDYSYKIDVTDNGSVAASSVYTTTYYDRQGSPVYVKDPNGIITTEYHYRNDIGANKVLDYVQDNLTKTKTYFKENGEKDYVINDMDVVVTRFFDGYSVNYLTGSDSLDDKNFSSTEVTELDIDGKALYTTLKKVEYNSDGSIDRVMEDENTVLEKYFYKNVDGNKVIDYVVNYKNSEFGNIRTYLWYDDENRPMYLTSDENKPTDDTAANILQDFSWNGNTLVYTFDRTSNNTKWYNSDKQWVYETFNERIISKNIYNRGKLVAKWEPGTKEATIYTNERAWIKLKLEKEPTAQGVDSLLANAAAINDEINNHGDGSVLNGILVKYGLLEM